MNQFEIQEIIRNIEQELNDSTFDLVSILHKILKVASSLNHQQITKWIHNELGGYERIDTIPSYRQITYMRYMILSNGSRSDSGEVKSSRWEKSIINTIKSSKNTISIFTQSALFFNYEIHIKSPQFLKIIEGVRAKINEYISKVLTLLGDVKTVKYQQGLDEIEQLLTSTNLKSYFEDENELEIFKNNMIALLQFEVASKFVSNFKYCKITMGPIIEFLLKRYYKVNKIKPERFNDKEGNNFSNYIEAAIKKNIFGEKKDGN